MHPVYYWYVVLMNYQKGMEYVRSLGIQEDEAREQLTQLLHHKNDGLEYIVIKVGGECVNGNLPQQIATLNQFGLYPIIVHGGGPQIDEEMKRRGVPIMKVNGQRSTPDAQTLDCVVTALRMVNKDLVAKINEYGGSAQTLNQYEIVQVEQQKDLGYVGEPVSVDTHVLTTVTRRYASPVLWCIGYKDHQKYNVNADRIATAIIRHIGPMHCSKLIMVTSAGGVLDDNHELMSSINYSDIERLIKDRIAIDGMAEKLGQARKLYDDISGSLDSRFKLQLIQPHQLLSELLTAGGSGTQIIWK